MLEDNTSQTPSQHISQLKIPPGSQPLAEKVRQQVLATFDEAWATYLTALEELRQGIGLRAYGGQKPLPAFEKEAFTLWNGFGRTLRSKIAADLAGLGNEA